MIYRSIFDGPLFFNYMKEIRNDLSRYKTDFDQLLTDLKKIVQSENKIYKQKVLMDRLDRSTDDNRFYGPIKPKINKFNSTFSLGPRSNKYMDFAFEKLKNIVSQNNLSSLLNMFKALNEFENSYNESRQTWYQYLEENDNYDDYESYKKNFEDAALVFVRELLHLKRKVMKKSQSIVSEAENILRIQYNIFQDYTSLISSKKTKNLIKVCELRHNYQELFVKFDSVDMISPENIIKELDKFKSYSVFLGYGFLNSKKSDSLIYMNINSDRALSIYNPRESDKNKDYCIENIESKSENSDEINFDFYLVDVNDYSHLEIVPISMVSTAQAKKLRRVIKRGYQKHSAEFINRPRYKSVIEQTSVEKEPDSPRESFSVDDNELKIASNRLKSTKSNPKNNNEKTFHKILTDSSNKNKAETKLKLQKNNPINTEPLSRKEPSLDSESSEASGKNERPKKILRRSGALFMKNNSQEEISERKRMSRSSSSEFCLHSSASDDKTSITHTPASTTEMSDISMTSQDFDIDIVVVKKPLPRRGLKINDTIKLRKTKSVSLESFLTNKSYGASIKFIQDLFEILNNDLSFLKSTQDLNIAEIDVKKVSKKNILNMETITAYDYLRTILTVKTKPILQFFETKYSSKINTSKYQSFYEGLDDYSRLIISLVFDTLDKCQIDLVRVSLSNWTVVNNLGALLFKQAEEAIQNPSDDNFRIRLSILELFYAIYKNDKANLDKKTVESSSSQSGVSVTTVKKPMSHSDGSVKSTIITEPSKPQEPKASVAAVEDRPLPKLPPPRASKLADSKPTEPVVKPKPIEEPPKKLEQPKKEDPIKESVLKSMDKEKSVDEQKIKQKSIEDKPGTKVIQKSIDDKPEQKAIQKSIDDKPEQKVVQKSIDDKSEQKVVQKSIDDKSFQKVVQKSIDDKPEQKVVQKSIDDKPEQKVIQKSIDDKPEPKVVQKSIDKPEPKATYSDQKSLSIENKKLVEPQVDSDTNIMDEISKLVTEIESAAGTGSLYEDVLKNDISSEGEKLNEEAANILTEIFNEFSDFTNESTKMMGGINKTRPKPPGKLKKPKQKLDDSGVFSCVTEEKLDVSDMRSPTLNNSRDSLIGQDVNGNNNLGDSGQKMTGLNLATLTNVITKIKQTPKNITSETSENTSKKELEQPESPKFGIHNLKSRGKQNTNIPEEKESSPISFGTNILKSWKNQDPKPEKLSEDPLKINSPTFGKFLLKSKKDTEDQNSKDISEKSENVSPTMIRNKDDVINSPVQKRESIPTKDSQALPVAEEKSKFKFFSKTTSSSDKKKSTSPKKLTKSSISSPTDIDSPAPKRKFSTDKSGKIDKSLISQPTLINEDFSDVKLRMSIDNQPKGLFDSTEPAQKKSFGKTQKINKISIGNPQPIQDEDAENSQTKVNTVDTDRSSLPPIPQSAGLKPSSQKSQKNDRLSISQPQPIDTTPENILPSITKQGLEYSNISNLNDHFQNSPPPIISEIPLPKTSGSESGKNSRSSKSDSIKGEKPKSSKGKGILGMWKK